MEYTILNGATPKSFVNEIYKNLEFSKMNNIKPLSWAYYMGKIIGWTYLATFFDSTLLDCDSSVKYVRLEKR